MIIKQPDVQPKNVTMETISNEWFVKKALQPLGQVKIHHLSRKNITRPEPVPFRERARDDKSFENPGASLFVQGIHHAFNKHQPLLFTPDLFWSALKHEANTAISKNPKKHAKKCTDKPDEKIVLVVRDDSLSVDEPCDWASNTPRFKSLLLKHVPEETMGIFFPKFSTTTPEMEVAHLISFMGSMSSYFTYRELTACGIPEIKLAGTQQDWALLVEHAQKLAAFLPELEGYFEVLIPILQKISHAWICDKIDSDFWKSIYHYKSESGQDWVSGWINTLFAYELKAKDFADYRAGIKDFFLKESFSDWQRAGKVQPGGGTRYSGGCTPDHFPSHVVRVPFIWDYRVDDQQREIPMAFISGPLGIELVDDKYITPQLGFGVVEILENQGW